VHFLTFFDSISIHECMGSIPLFFYTKSSTNESRHVSMDPFFPHYDVGPFFMYYIWSLQSQEHLVPLFVPLADQHVSMDTYFIPLPKATFTKLWNHVGVGDKAFKGVIYSLYGSGSNYGGML
jgi:hypothetical protein